MKLPLHIHPRAEAPRPGPCFAVWLPLEGSQELLGAVGKWTTDLEHLRGVRLPSGGCLLRLTQGHFASPPPSPAIACSYQRGLFVFADAELSPAFSEAELKALAPYPRLFLSPSGRLCGWEESDEFRLSDLIQAPPPEPSGWRTPPEPPPWPSQMRGIVLEKPLLSPEEILGEMGGDIGSEPLLLPEGDTEKPVSRRDFDGVQISPAACAIAGLVIVSLLFCALMLCASALGELTSGVVAIFALIALILLALVAIAAKSLRSGATQQAESRAESNLSSRRRRAIEEMLEELRHNRAAGLRKAIPFASGGGLGRGLAGAGASLGTRNTDFNLGALFGAGGGSFGTSWTLEQSLQEKLKHAYRAAAEEEMKAGNYRRAAYIYAHLLGSFMDAAQCLEKGRFFAEAAVVWEKKLKNFDAAARCHIQCGQIDEAVRCLLELKRLEDAALLLEKHGRQAEAKELFRRAADAARERGQNLEAARLWDERLRDRPAALKILSDTWDSDHREALPALLRSFELMAGDAASAHLRLLQLRQQMTQRLRPQLPPALPKMARDWPHLRDDFDELHLLCAQVAFRQSSANEARQILLSLASRRPEDRLLQDDCVRLAAMASGKLVEKKSNKLRAPKLICSHAATKEDQFLEIHGLKCLVALYHDGLSRVYKARDGQQLGSWVFTGSRYVPVGSAEVAFKGDTYEISLNLQLWGGSVTKQIDSDQYDILFSSSHPEAYDWIYVNEEIATLNSSCEGAEIQWAGMTVETPDDDNDCIFTSIDFDGQEFLIFGIAGIAYVRCESNSFSRIQNQPCYQVKCNPEFHPRAAIFMIDTEVFIHWPEIKKTVKLFSPQPQTPQAILLDGNTAAIAVPGENKVFLYRFNEAGEVSEELNFPCPGVRQLRALEGEGRFCTLGDELCFWQL